MSGAPLRGIAAVISCIAVYGMAGGAAYPLLSLVLESRGVADSVIGMNAAVGAAATVIAVPLFPRILARVPVRAFLLAAVAVELAAFLLLAVSDSLAAWFVLRFFIGASAAGLYVAGEAWLLAISPDNYRGRIAALYNCALGGCFALGPLLVTVAGVEGAAPFLLVAALIALAAVPLVFAGPAPDFGGGAGFGITSFVRAAPVLTLAVFLVAYADSLLLALLSVYGVRHGLGVAAAAVMLTVFGTGAVLLQLPLGWLADVVERYRLMAACAATALVLAAALPFLIQTPLLWPLLLALGGMLSGLYTVALAVVGQRFRGRDLVTANAAFGMAWGIGGFTGPTLAGAAMQQAPAAGLPAVLAVMLAVFLLLLWRRRLRAGAARNVLR
ncbi:MAG: MFS transporter [Gammaproteobacteria bacterium]|nr:MFS transporter [Gammaproteobacteria bacterium]